MVVSRLENKTHNSAVRVAKLEQSVNRSAGAGGNGKYGTDKGNLSIRVVVFDVHQQVMLVPHDGEPCKFPIAGEH